MTATPLTVVTGANRGIGLALVERLAARGRAVLAVARRPSSGLAAAGVQVVEGVELTAAAGRASVAAAVGARPVDLLLNVAGVMEWERFGEIEEAQIARQVAINATAPLLLTQALAPRLAAGARVAFLTSRLGSITDNARGEGYGYRMSKAALNMAVKTLSVDLAPRGVTVAALHPGSVKTSLNRLGGEIAVETAADGLIARIDALTPAQTGVFLHQNGTSLAW